MKRGLNSLASITSVAPLVGLLGTTLGMLNSFRGISGDKSTILAPLCGELSQACVPTAMGLLIGLLSLFYHTYLTGRLQDFDHEMEIASLELVNHLARPAISAR
jgi:biopolymer transport protein ExbB/TolQ